LFAQTDLTHFRQAPYPESRGKKELYEQKEPHISSSRVPFVSSAYLVVSADKFMEVLGDKIIIRGEKGKCDPSAFPSGRHAIPLRLSSTSLIPLSYL
jgi:hypothetical protein